MIIAVGSKNPTKLKAVETVFSYYFENVKVVGISVKSGVSEQPLTEDETFNGALTRAKRALEKIAHAQFGVGIEAGIHEHSYGWIKRELIVVCDIKGRIGIGSSGGLILPKKIIEKVLHGKKLEKVIDEMFATNKIGEKGGVLQILSKGKTSRKKNIEEALILALTPFLHMDIYEE